MNADTERIAASEEAVESLGPSENSGSGNTAERPSEDLPPSKYIEHRNDQVEAKKGGYQKRLNKITAEKHQLRGENEQLRARLDSIEQRLAPLDQTEPAHGPNAERNEPEQAGNDNPGPSADYRRQEYEREQEARASYQERIEKVVQERPDLSQKAAGIQIHKELLKVIDPALVELENGHDVVVHLIDNPSIVQKLHTMSPPAAVAYLGRISAQLENPPATEKLRSKAPAPITPIDTGANRSSVAMEDLPPSEYIKRRNAQQEKRRGW